MSRQERTRPAWWTRWLLFAAVIAATAVTYALSVPKPIVIAIAWTLTAAAVGAWLERRAILDRPAPRLHRWSAVLAPVGVYSTSVKMVIYSHWRIMVSSGAELFDHDGRPIGMVDTAAIVDDYLIASGTMTTDRVPVGKPSFSIKIHSVGAEIDAIHASAKIEAVYASHDSTPWWDDPLIGFKGDGGAAVEQNRILASLIRPGSPTRHE